MNKIKQFIKLLEIANSKDYFRITVLNRIQGNFFESYSTGFRYK